MFKRKMLVVFLLGCFVLGINMCVEAEEGVIEGSAIEVDADVTINSKYLWRGFMLDDDPVMQSGIYAGAYGFTISIWGSFDIGAGNDLDSDEVDYVIDYTREFDKFSLSAGHTYYDFPPADADSQEFYVGAELSAPLSPTLTWYCDYGDEDSGGGDGNYIVLGLSHSIALGDSPITVDLSGSAGYNDGLFINGSGGDVAMGAGLTIPLTENCSFSPNINYSVPFGDLKDSDDGNQDNEFYGGFTLAFSM